MQIWTNSNLLQFNSSWWTNKCWFKLEVSSIVVWTRYPVALQYSNLASYPQLMKKAYKTFYSTRLLYTITSENNETSERTKQLVIKREQRTKGQKFMLQRVKMLKHYLNNHISYSVFHSEFKNFRKHPYSDSWTTTFLSFCIRCLPPFFNFPVQRKRKLSSLSFFLLE